MQPTLRDIRYYDQTFHPDFVKLRGGKLWRVYFVLLLNWLRFWIETLVQHQMVKLMSVMEGHSKSDTRKLVSAFWEDVKAEAEASKKASPFYKAQYEPPVQTPRSLRYAVGRGSRVVSESEDQPERPVPLDNLVQRLGSTGRDRKYGMTVTVHEFEKGKKEE